MGLYFYPRGGSAHAARAIAHQLRRNGLDVTILAGSRSDLGDDARSKHFFGPDDVVEVDFTRALQSSDPARFADPDAAPMHASYEDRPGAEDPVIAALDDEAFEIQVGAWARELAEARAAEADLLYLHHLTPINEAAARAFPELPILGHVHGSELLMLERIGNGPPSGWRHAKQWVARLVAWAERCDRVVVNSPEGLDRAAALLDLDPAKLVLVPNGFDPCFHPFDLDRRVHWRARLVAEPRGWRPGSGPGSVRYVEADLDGLKGPTLLYSGRFTEVKRLPLLIEAFAAARERFAKRAALVLLGGYPGEWEGEHPIETIERIAVPDVFLAGWHGQDELPRFLAASDILVHASVREQFGQVLVEAMACAIPPIAVARGGPAAIIDHGTTGWLVPPDDRGAMVEAMVEAVNHPELSRERGRQACRVAGERYTWGQIGKRLVAVLGEVAAMPADR